MVNSVASQDKIAMKQWLSSSDGKSAPDRNLTAANMAYPIITSRVWNVVAQQCVHIINGCLSKKTILYRKLKDENYCGTGIKLPLYRSL